MNRDQILSTTWNWLPAFRAVAETEHLPTASARLNVTSSALSRTIKQLEEIFGQELFLRTGRRLVLNAAGARLLEAVKEATNSLDSAIEAIMSDPMEGPLRISTIGVLTNEYVLPAVLDLKARFPALVPQLSNQAPREANELLVRNQLDVAFYYDALTHEELTIESIGASTASVYCGAGHELFGAGQVSLDELLAHPFSVPATGDRGLAMDGWPVEVPRKIGMRITLLTTNLEVCLSGRLVTVLPDVVAYPHLQAQRLRRFPFDLIQPIKLFSARRKDDLGGQKVTELVEAIKGRIEQIDATLASNTGEKS